MTGAAYQREFNLSEPAHGIGHNSGAPRTSAEKGEVVRLIPVLHCDVLHGVDYLRTAVDLIHLVLPGHLSDHVRAGLIARATGISLSVIERILAHKREGLQSIKTEYLVTLFRLATRNGRNVFDVRGVREVHDAIFGSAK